MFTCSHLKLRWTIACSGSAKRTCDAAFNIQIAKPKTGVDWLKVGFG
jgi:hypothetical protein